MQPAVRWSNRVPTADELAAIAAAYAAVAPRAETAPKAAVMSRWSLAGRLPHVDDQGVRFAAASASRWNAAGRLDG
jgi:hypothetical protein